MAKKVLEKLTCRGCGATSAEGVDRRSGYNVGEVMRQTGYEAVMFNDIRIGWLCPVCADRLAPHVRAIVEILRDEGDEVFWGGLRHLAEHRAEVARAAQLASATGENSVRTEEVGPEVGPEVVEERRRMVEEVEIHATRRGLDVIMSQDVWRAIAKGICPRPASHAARDEKKDMI